MSADSKTQGPFLLIIKHGEYKGLVFGTHATLLPACPSVLQGMGSQNRISQISHGQGSRWEFGVAIRMYFGEIWKAKARQRPEFSVATPSAASKVQEALGSSMMVLARVPARRCRLHGTQEAGLKHPCAGADHSSVAWFRSRQPLKHGSPRVFPGTLLRHCRSGSSFLGRPAL